MGVTPPGDALFWLRLDAPAFRRGFSAVLGLGLIPTFPALKRALYVIARVFHEEGL